MRREERRVELQGRAPGGGADARRALEVGVHALDDGHGAVERDEEALRRDLRPLVPPAQVDLGELVRHRLDLLERRLPPRVGVRVGGHALAQLAFDALLFRQTRRVAQPGIDPQVRLGGVRRAERDRVEGVRALGILAQEVPQRRAERHEAVGLRPVERVALVLELRHREVPVGAPRVPGRENELAVGRRLRAPLEEERVGVRRLAVLVGAQEREVERVTRVAEVVRVAAEVAERDVRRERQADVVVVLEHVQVEARPAEHGNELGMKPRELRARLGQDGALVRGQRALTLPAGQVEVDAREDALADVAHRVELPDAPPGDAQLLLQRAGDVAVRAQVPARVLHRAQVVAHHVVVREDQPARRDEGRAPPSVPQRGQLHPLEPLGARLEVVGLPQVVEREVLERPHLPGGRRLGRRRGLAGRREEEADGERGNQRQSLHSGLPRGGSERTGSVTPRAAGPADSSLTE